MAEREPLGFIEHVIERLGKAAKLLQGAAAHA
jgi:hypothetical protein